MNAYRGCKVTSRAAVILLAAFLLFEASTGARAVKASLVEHLLYGKGVHVLSGDVLGKRKLGARATYVGCYKVAGTYQLGQLKRTGTCPSSVSAGLLQVTIDVDCSYVATAAGGIEQYGHYKPSSLDPRRGSMTAEEVRSGNRVAKWAAITTWPATYQVTSRGVIVDTYRGCTLAQQIIGWVQRPRQTPPPRPTSRPYPVAGRLPPPAFGPTSGEVGAKTIGQLPEPEPETPPMVLDSGRPTAQPITGRVHYHRKYKDDTRYPEGVHVRCYWHARGGAKHELCATTTSVGGYFKCDNPMVLVDEDEALLFSCQFEALPGVTLRYRTPEMKGGYDVGDVTVYPDRRRLPGCMSNNCGPRLLPLVGEQLEMWGLPIGGDNIVPDCWFTDFCNNHDCCYSECGVRQSQCDQEFRELALSHCRIGDGGVLLNQLCYKLGGCNEATVGAYYFALTKAGGEAFDIAQRSGCLDE